MSEKNKEYLLFAGGYYYPLGGFNDYHGSFATTEEAYKEIKRLSEIEPYSDGSPNEGYDEYRWAHIVYREDTVLNYEMSEGVLEYVGQS